ncbi:MAG: hypothetical protein AAFZ15_07670 [Bacteroidota bacterium]
MDLFKTWEKINQEKFSNQTIKKEEIMKAISKESSLTINELKKRLKYKIYWIVFFIALFIGWFIFSLSYPTVLPLIGTILSLYLIGFFVLFRQYKKMDTEIDPSMNILATMKKNKSLMEKALKHENYFGLVGFPVAVVCGLILGDLYEGQTILEVLSSSKTLVRILIFMVILVPAMKLLGDKMNNIAYGKYLKDLDTNIQKMEELV